MNDWLTDPPEPPDEYWEDDDDEDVEDDDEDLEDEELTAVPQIVHGIFVGYKYMPTTACYDNNFRPIRR